nr:hypothetical protein CFP56_03121 [Quercus suber]
MAIGDSDMDFAMGKLIGWDRLRSSMDGAFLIWDALIARLARDYEAFPRMLVRRMFDTLHADSPRDEIAQDADKEAAYLWLVHLVDVEQAIFKPHVQESLRAELVKWCCLYPDHWTQVCGQKLLDAGDDFFQECWQDLLQASMLREHDGSEKSPRDEERMSMDAEEPCTPKRDMLTGASEDEDIPRDWARYAIAPNLPIGVVTCGSSSARRLQRLLPLDDGLLEAQQEDGLAGPHLVALAGPVSGDAVGGEGGGVADALDEAGDEGGAVELAHLLGDADVGVDDGLVVDDHVLILFGVALLEGVGGAAEEGAPNGAVDEVQQVEQARGPLDAAAGGLLAVQQQVEQLDADRVAGAVQPGLDLADRAGLGVVVGDQAVEQVGEAGERGLGGLGAVQVAVVDGLAVGGVAQGGLEGLGGWQRDVGGAGLGGGEGRGGEGGGRVVEVGRGWHGGQRMGWCAVVEHLHRRSSSCLLSHVTRVVRGGAVTRRASTSGRSGEQNRAREPGRGAAGVA